MSFRTNNFHYWDNYLCPQPSYEKYNKTDGSLQPTTRVIGWKISSFSTVKIMCTATTPGSWQKLPIFHWSKTGRSPIDDNSYKYKPSINPRKTLHHQPNEHHCGHNSSNGRAVDSLQWHTKIYSTYAGTNNHHNGDRKISRSYIQMSCWETFKLILFITSLVLVCVFLIAFFRYFGIFALFFVICCNHRPWLHSSHVRRRRRQEILDSLPAVAFWDQYTGWFEGIYDEYSLFNPTPKSE